MSVLAWRILSVLVEHAAERDFESGYMAGWTLGKRLGGDASTIQAAHVKFNTGNEYEKALHELVQLGIVEEMPDLGERWKLVVK
jgi:hypothetical protein